MQSLPRILIGCPIRDRAWILPRYLKSLAALSPEFDISYGFIVNDCSDRTPEMLRRFQAENPGQVMIIEHNLSSRHSSLRGGYAVHNLVILRNLLISLFLSGKWDYLFSVDSDILVEPDTLRVLLDANLPVVSALIENGQHLGGGSFSNICALQGRSFRPMGIPEEEGLIPVDLTGAVILIKRSVLAEKGVRYHYHRQGEDAGFCLDARQKGIPIYCHTGVRPQHIMLKPDTNIEQNDAAEAHFSSGVHSISQK